MKTCFLILVTAITVLVGYGTAEAQMVARRSVVYQHAPAVAYTAPAVTYTYTAPSVTYYQAPVQTRRVESTVSVRHDGGQTGAQRRHARKAEEHLRKASKWGTRS